MVLWEVSWFFFYILGSFIFGYKIRTVHGLNLKSWQNKGERSKSRVIRDYRILLANEHLLLTLHQSINALGHLFISHWCHIHMDHFAHCHRLIGLSLNWLTCFFLLIVILQHLSTGINFHDLGTSSWGVPECRIQCGQIISRTLSQLYFSDTAG